MTAVIDMTIPSRNLFIPNQIGNVDVKYNGHLFSVIDDSKTQYIERWNTEKELRGISIEQLQKCLSAAYLVLKKVDNTYSIEMKYRLLGGGPIAGAIGYWATKTFCYGTAVAAGGTAVVATGGALGGAIGAAAGGALVGGASIPAGVGAVAGAISTSTAATALATEATVATIATGGSIAGAMAVVESASAFVGGVLTMCPFLP